MAKKRSGKRSGGKGKSRWNPFSGRLFLTLIFYAVIIGGAAYGLRYFYTSSDFFSVREIYINRDTGSAFKEGEAKLKRLFSGKNIFLVDLKEVQDIVKQDFPQLKKVEARRRFPDRIEIDMLTREPVAVIDYGGGVVIDREAVVVYAGPGKSEGLLRIKGVGFFLNMPSRGDRIRNPMLEKGLVLLDGVRKKMGPNLKNIDYIDISDKNNIILSIHGVAVKMGADDFSHKIDRLNEMLDDPKLNLNEINYIDLRFSDAVIAPK